MSPVSGASLERLIVEPTSTPPAAPHSEPPHRTEDSAWSRAFTRVGRDIDQGEAWIRRATQPGAAQSSDPATLIALQAGIYRYSEALDLAAKVVDRAGGAVRTVLSGSGH